VPVVRALIFVTERNIYLRTSCSKQKLSQSAGTLKTGSPKSMALLNIMIGFLDLVLIPAEEMQLTHFNYAVAELNSALAVVVIIVALVDYLNKRGGGKNLIYPLITFLISIVWLFLYPQKYDNPIAYQLHLYIIDTESKTSLFYLGYYAVRDAIWGLSFAFGMMLFITSLYEIYLVRKERKRSHF